MPKLGVRFEGFIVGETCNFPDWNGNKKAAFYQCLKRPSGWFWSYWHMCWRGGAKLLGSLNTIDANLLWRILFETHRRLDLVWRHLDLTLCSRCILRCGSRDWAFTREHRQLESHTVRVVLVECSRVVISKHSEHQDKDPQVRDI